MLLARNTHLFTALPERRRDWTPFATLVVKTLDSSRISPDVLDRGANSCTGAANYLQRVVAKTVGDQQRLVGPQPKRCVPARACGPQQYQQNSSPAPRHRLQGNCPSGRFTQPLSADRRRISAQAAFRAEGQHAAAFDIGPIRATSDHSGTVTTRKQGSRRRVGPQLYQCTVRMSRMF